MSIISFGFRFLKTQAEFEARKAKEKVSNLDGENEVSYFFKEVEIKPLHWI